jgi:hypothetical protein
MPDEPTQRISPTPSTPPPTSELNKGRGKLYIAAAIAGLVGVLVGGGLGAAANKPAAKTVTVAGEVTTVKTPTKTVTHVVQHIVVHVHTHTVTITTAAQPTNPETSGEEDEVGSSSHATDAQFCSEHQCIGSFETEDGTIVECSDGSYSHSGGISGACSDHGGESE